MRYELVHELANEFAVDTLYQVLEVSQTAYYRYLRGGSYQLSPEKSEYQQLVMQTFSEHKRRYAVDVFRQSCRRKAIQWDAIRYER